MTTVIVDCKNQKVYADSCTTVSQLSHYSRNVAGILLTKPSEESEHEHRVVRRESDKIHKVGATVLVGAGDADLIKRFVNSYAEGDACRIRDGDGDCTIFAISKRGDGLLIDTYKPKMAKKRWFLRKQKVWDISTQIKSQGYITIGSGGSYAAGALEAGSCGEDAIKIASKLDIHTDDNVKMESL